jgi:hypothetical protein
MAMIHPTDRHLLHQFRNRTYRNTSVREYEIPRGPRKGLELTTTVTLAKARRNRLCRYNSAYPPKSPNEEVRRSENVGEPALETNPTPEPECGQGGFRGLEGLDQIGQDWMEGNGGALHAAEH